MKTVEDVQDARIEVRIENVYGTRAMYPHCEKAEIFARMLGQKTLTEKNVEYIKELGFKVFAVTENKNVVWSMGEI